MIHDIETWEDIIGALPQPEGVTHYKVLADYILTRLEGYGWKGGGRLRDVEELAGMLEALVRLELDAVRTEGNR